MKAGLEVALMDTLPSTMQSDGFTQLASGVSMLLGNSNLNGPMKGNISEDDFYEDFELDDPYVDFDVVTWNSTGNIVGTYDEQDEEPAKGELIQQLNKDISRWQFRVNNFELKRSNDQAGVIYNDLLKCFSEVEKKANAVMFYLHQGGLFEPTKVFRRLLPRTRNQWVR
ncbi:MAG: hypothetical protein P0S93_04390 [Candidatus Neptunochlamydia sp.]|nr:hypothetical protein [Candidatus Neptunochlamydia sp.]